MEKREGEARGRGRAGQGEAEARRRHRGGHSAAALGETERVGKQHVGDRIVGQPAKRRLDRQRVSAVEQREIGREDVCPVLQCGDAEVGVGRRSRAVHSERECEDCEEKGRGVRRGAG